MSITIIIIIITGIISFMAFNNHDLMDKLIFYPPDITNRKQWYRFFSNGLIHADIGHLLFNMLSLYFFGDYVNSGFSQIFGSAGTLLYLVMYVSALAICLIPTYRKNKDNYYYRSLGASGAVSAVVFAGILLYPDAKLSLLFLPIPIPGFIFGPLYLIITAYLNKRGGGNINHSAHLWGSLYGVAFVIVLSFALNTGFNPLTHFVDAIRNSLMR
ncbi:rhomboid family intramembrane serine protease [Parafilimonas sp.]|uniref:rhomboid family intramembrane serine protease n=1 Tax=Parafilimonas sp. TaxID=1969739 RepID=UPI0039E34792